MSKEINRRRFIKISSGAAIGMAVSGKTAGLAFTENMKRSCGDHMHSCPPKIGAQETSTLGNASFVDMPL